ncbi:hypothetical protein [Nocardia abscessus]|uniref:hypothetical protein n=1 Tax=Nocardia abscessus TaxID=120957 RepID=UPI002454E767|nr:hypothetical protein [Nocardia abscessus]
MGVGRAGRIAARTAVAAALTLAPAAVVATAFAVPCHGTATAGCAHNPGGIEDRYGADGFDDFGRDRSGRDRFGYDSFGYDSFGYDRSGRDRSGYDRSGRDRFGYDRWGYDRSGYTAQGCARTGEHRPDADHAVCERLRNSRPSTGSS